MPKQRKVFRISHDDQGNVIIPHGPVRLADGTVIGVASGLSKPGYPSSPPGTSWPTTQAMDETHVRIGTSGVSPRTMAYNWQGSMPSFAQNRMLANERRAQALVDQIRGYSEDDEVVPEKPDEPAKSAMERLLEDNDLV